MFGPALAPTADHVGDNTCMYRQVSPQATSSSVIIGGAWKCTVHLAELQGPISDQSTDLVNLTL
jgi:hypothetical protein